MSYYSALSELLFHSPLHLVLENLILCHREPISIRAGKESAYSAGSPLSRSSQHYRSFVQVCHKSSFTVESAGTPAILGIDHFLVIKGPAYAVPKITCLCQPNDYDGQGIAEFPERMGWRIDRTLGPVGLMERESQIKSPDALLQFWLFFGMIRDFFQTGGLNVDLKDFVYHLAGGLFVTSASLRVHLDRLAASAQELTRNECLQRQQLNHDLLRQVFGSFAIYWDAMHRFDRWGASSVLRLD